MTSGLPVTLHPWGPVVLKLTALKGGVLRVMPDARMCLFGKVKIETFAKHKIVMSIVAQVSASKLAVLNTGSALVQGVSYRADGGTWTPTSISKPAGGSKH